MQIVEQTISIEQLKEIAQHRELANGKWATMSLCEQMANIGSECSRLVKWLTKNNSALAESTFYRLLELIDLTIKQKIRSSALKEICRLRENICASYLERNIDDLAGLNTYFFHFAIARC